jgi:Asp-tRNA(Asn)/Glu-tRNA(Gln) amidotransferase A subunit family amidase
MPGLPPRRDASPEDLSAFRAETIRFTAASSMTGCPQLVIPVHHVRSGQRFGAGLAGPVRGDATLLRLAALMCPGEGPAEISVAE